jgi:oxygen-independent coproporphyrinogen-3 oxidase
MTDAATTTPRPEPATERNRSRDTGVGSVFVSNYPPYSAWSEAEVAAALRVLNAPAPRPETPLGLYLHIPFCRKRCKFCYFRVYTDKNAADIERYTDALAREIDLYAERPAVTRRRLSFVYFGGGTPSYISTTHLEALVDRARAALPWDAVEEVTFECEPGTLTRTKLEAIRGIGVTRLSLGIENFDDEILRENGRAHVSKEIYRVLPWIEELGFDQLNVDLIAGMVGETWETWKETVARTLEVAPDSVTLYQMELPYNARFSQDVLAGRFEKPLADWETKRAWQDWAFERFCEEGYEQSSAYTVVRRRRGEAGSRFLYRDSLWHGADLLGTGVASFGHVQGVHMQNASDWTSYLEALEAGHLPLYRAFETGPDERLTRELILQLKLGRLATQPFEEKFGVDVLDLYEEPLRRLESEGMLAVHKDDGDRRIELSRRGLLQVDTLLPEFYAKEYRGARYT